MEAAKDENVRLVAIAKERLFSERFVAKYWQEPAEIYFDSAEKGYPFFEATNGQQQALGPFLLSHLLGGKAAENWKKGDDSVPNNPFFTFRREELTHPILGSLLVVSHTGEILYHHKEKMMGDQPDFEELKAAIKKLGGSGAASCECPEDESDFFTEVADSEVPGMSTGAVELTTITN